MGNVIPLRPTKMRQRSGFPYAGLPMRNDALKGSKLNYLRQSAFIPTGAITTKDGNLIVLTSDYNFVLTVDGFQPLDLLMSAGIAVTTSDNKLISK